MKSLFVSYALYNSWANSLLLEVLLSLPEEVQKQERVSSFNSLYGTVLHLLDAESIWWQRMKLQEQIRVPSETFAGGMKELATALQKEDQQWVDWISGTTELMLEHQFIFYNSKREPLKQTVFQMLLHLFNHGTYHRGQLVTLLRQAGAGKIPSTDYMVWVRKKGTDLSRVK